MFADFEDNTLADQIMEEFNSFQPEIWTPAQLRDPSPELEAIRLNEEIDEQYWQSHIQLTKPLANVNSTCPLTCDRQLSSSRRWKNAYGEGTYITYTSMLASSWGEQDYEMMEITPINLPNTPIPPKPRKELPEDWDQERVVTFGEPISLPSATIAEIDALIAILPTIPLDPPLPTIRVQLTLKEKGKNIRGFADNVQVKGATMEQVVSALAPLNNIPKLPHPHRSVRVQIQNLINGVMKGGGNFQIHDYTVSEVAREVRLLLDAANLYTVGAAPGMEKVAKSQGVGTAITSQSEEGSRKPGNVNAISSGGGGLLTNTQKSDNDRLSRNATRTDCYPAELMEEMHRIAAGGDEV